MRKFKGQKYTKEEALKLVDECYENDEPVFIIRAKDYVSHKAIMSYAEHLKNATGPDNHGSPSYNLAENAERFASEVLQWQLNNRATYRLPD